MRTALIAAGLAASLLSSCSNDTDVTRTKVLRFSAIPNQDETRLREKFAPVAKHLSERLGVPVEYQHATDYNTAVDLFKNGDVHLAWFGGLSGVKARRAVPGARAIAQGEADPKYYSFFIANKSTGIERGESFPAAIAGKRFTFGSKGSTSGRLMPEFFIRENSGKTPSEFFGHPDAFAGNHDSTIELVEAGTYEVGACDYKVYERRVQEGETDPDVCRVVWKTPYYPDYNFTAHPQLEETFGEGFTDKLQRVLLGMEGEELMAPFLRTRFVEATNDDFKRVEELALELELTR